MLTKALAVIALGVITVCLCLFEIENKNVFLAMTISGIMSLADGTIAFPGITKTKQ